MLLHWQLGACGSGRFCLHNKHRPSFALLHRIVLNSQSPNSSFSFPYPIDLLLARPAIDSLSLGDASLTTFAWDLVSCHPQLKRFHVTPLTCCSICPTDICVKPRMAIAAHFLVCSWCYTSLHLHAPRHASSDQKWLR